MIADFLLRLLVALPLVLGLAVGTLLLMRRGWLPQPPAQLLHRLGDALPGGPVAAREPLLDLVASRTLQPGVRVAVLRHAGRDYLVAVSTQGVTLLAAEAAPATPEAGARPVLRPAAEAAE